MSPKPTESVKKKVALNSNWTLICFQYELVENEMSLPVLDWSKKDKHFSVTEAMTELGPMYEDNSSAMHSASDQSGSFFTGKVPLDPSRFSDC